VVDLFDEVEEQLRSERYKTMAAKAAPFAIGLLVLALVVTLGVWGWETYSSRQANKASDAYIAAVELRDARQEAKAKAAFQALADHAPKTYRALALMQLGGYAVEANDAKGAVAQFDKAAAVGADPIITDMARLKSAFALMDTASYADIKARLDVIADPKRPYHSVAKEALAFARLQSGDIAGARSDFNALSLALDSSDDLRQRAQRVMQLIDAGSAKDLAAEAKAAMALPPEPEPQAGGAQAPQAQEPQAPAPQAAESQAAAPQPAAPAPRPQAAQPQAAQPQPAQPATPEPQAAAPAAPAAPAAQPVPEPAQ
jgi:hypothetical protein